MKNVLYILAVVTCLLSGVNASAQSTLFDFPVAPDTCSNIESRCNYSVQHFWENCNLTKPFEAKNDSLLMDAMLTYFEIMKAGANVNVSLASVRDLMFKAQANHDNYTKLLSIAEDDLYLAFAKSAADASWLKKDARNHYSEQVKRIESSKLGAPIYDFEFNSITGVRKHLTDVKSSAKLYVLLFSDNNTGSSIERMRLNTDIAFGKAVESGQIEVVNIMIGDTPKKWDDDSQSYSSTWIVGASKDAYEKLDLRIIPCVYILDENLNVIAKNKTVDFVKNLMSR